MPSFWRPCFLAIIAYDIRLSSCGSTRFSGGRAPCLFDYCNRRAAGCALRIMPGLLIWRLSCITPVRNPDYGSAQSQQRIYASTVAGLCHTRSVEEVLHVVQAAMDEIPYERVFPGQLLQLVVSLRNISLPLQKPWSRCDQE